MCRGNGTSQCALGIGLANVLYEWDYWASQCTVGMGLANVPCEFQGLSNVHLGMGLPNEPWE